MSAQEIIAELPKLKPEELQRVKAGLAELERQQTPPERSVWDALLEFAGTAEGLPPDLAENHDHYLHGSSQAETVRFADTAYFLALLNPRDGWHEAALRLSRRREGPLLTTVWILPRSRRRTGNRP